MPMYYPDLESVRNAAIKFSKYMKPYKGIIPEKDSDLPEARMQLGKYMREVGKDEIWALEIELGVSKENYHHKLREHMFKKFLGDK